MKGNFWYAVKKQSIAKYARISGFDLSIYETYSPMVRIELKKRAISEAISAIEQDTYEEHGFWLSSISKGVYAISLSNPLSIQYRFGWSPVIYIGRGTILSRIESHFKGSLFDFMLSPSGADFDFAFARPARKNNIEYYKHVEHEMLKYFSQKLGGRSDSQRFPILNKYAGSNKNIVDATAWWTQPLKATGKKPLWAIAPTQHSDFAPLD